jgi:predicted SnoaL-like aldol condensation-catalyzing enzyme
MKTKLIYSSMIFGLMMMMNSSDAQMFPDQRSMLKSNDSKLATNKLIAYDFWREVLEAGHMELADKYMTETYIQHNPNVPTGRQGFINFFSSFVKPHTIIDTIQAPLIAIVAEGDLVTLVFKRELPDPKDQTKKYTTTSFDMFRIEGRKVAEHWDAALKQ